MAAIGGDILEITYNHSTLGTGTFFPKSQEEGTKDLGGLKKDDDEAGITGAGEAIYKMTRKRWMYEIVVANDANTDQDLERAQALAESPIEADWTFTHVNGTVYGGTGSVVGDIQGNEGAATFTLKTSGGGKLEKIVG